MEKIKIGSVINLLPGTVTEKGYRLKEWQIKLDYKVTAVTGNIIEIERSFRKFKIKDTYIKKSSN